MFKTKMWSLTQMGGAFTGYSSEHQVGSFTTKGVWEVIV